MQSPRAMNHIPCKSVKRPAWGKTHGKDIIIDARKCGQKDFGENYLKESIEKINQLREYDLSWHYIGNIQSNKIKSIAENFDWVHSIDSIRSLQKLSKYRPENYGSINVCLQVNIDDEKSKSGVKINEVDNFFTHAGALGSVNLRGLMAIPKQTNEYNLHLYIASLALKKVFDRIEYEALFQALRT